MPEKQMTPEQILAVLDLTPRLLEDLRGRFSPDLLQQEPAAGEWSLNQILVHLRTCEDKWGGAMELIADQEYPSIIAMNPRTWEKYTDYTALSFVENQAAFVGQRKKLLKMLNALTSEQWQRKANVSVCGKWRDKTIQAYGDMLARHERSHCRQLQKTAAALTR